jgi:hypothetical protein
MILDLSSKLFAIGKTIACNFSLYKTYRVISNAPIEVLWQKLIDLTDVSWNPLFSSTDVPFGLIPKPGLIFQAVTKLTPIPVRIFVENVRPKEFLSIRILAIPGIEQRIIYQVESTLCGTYISYSVKLSGWLSPLIWWLIRPYTARVASELAHAAEIVAK